MTLEPSLYGVSHLELSLQDWLYLVVPLQVCILCGGLPFIRTPLIQKMSYAIAILLYYGILCLSFGSEDP